MRNRHGVDITKGRWAVAEVSNGRGGRLVEGRIVGIDRHGEKVTLQARAPTANDPGCEVVFANTIVHAIGPMTVAPDGTVHQNPTPNLERYDQPSQREHVTPRGKRSKAPTERLKQRRLKTHHNKVPGVWANPLVRVKVKSPAQRGGGDPSPRLVARRKTTQKAPEGFYANPRALAPYKSAEVMASQGGFEFGMDSVTPVSWEFTTLGRARKGAYLSFKLPAEVISNADFQAWARGNGGRVIMSKRELVAKIKQLARV